MRARWKQVRRAGVVGLHPFTGAELSAVTLDANAVPEAERGPFLQVVTPLLTAPGTAGAPGPAARDPVTPGPALPEWAVTPDDATAAASAAAVRILVGWCGADIAAAGDERAADGGSEAGPLIPMPTAEVSGAFAAVTQLRVAVAQGPSVELRTLLVATGQGRHWLLDGERWQRAVPVSADGLSGQVAGLLRLPADG
jgi:hypothetical protein